MEAKMIFPQKAISEPPGDMVRTDVRGARETRGEMVS